MVDPITNEDELRQVALKRIKKRRDFYGHLVAYLIINAFLVLIWYLTSRGYFWPIWVIVGWGIGLAFNAWDAFGRTEVSESEVRAEMDKLRRSGPDGGR